jgi:glycosyltransferase involved in cell wall biosynthesis
MKITYISKWPPIEGGTSSQAYWTANGLAKKRVKIHVVTNAWEVESNHRLKIDFHDLDKYYPKNMKLFSTHGFEDIAHIPNSNPYAEKIASLAIEVTESYNTDLIDAGYILPYVISGYIVKTFTERPLIARHAGSDMKRLIGSEFLRRLFIEVLRRSDRIITSKSRYPTFSRFGVNMKNLRSIPHLNVDTEVFTPRGKKIDLSAYGKAFVDKPTLLYIGKTEYHKGIFHLIDALGMVDSDFTLMMVTNKKYRNAINQRLVRSKIEDKTVILDFAAPWKVPEIMRTADYVVCGEFDYPVPEHHPRIAREAMACGTTPIISEYLCTKYPYSELKNEENALIFDTKNIDNFSDVLEYSIKNVDKLDYLKKNARKFAEEKEEFDKYIDKTIKIYKEVV